MNGLGYAKRIVECVQKKNIGHIPVILEEFELDCFIRQYANLKLFNISNRLFYFRSYKDIKEDLVLFKNYLTEGLEKEALFYYGDLAILSLIASSIKPSDIVHSYTWLEQIRVLYENCVYQEVEKRPESIEMNLKHIKHSLTLKKYLKHKMLKNLKIFFPPIHNEFVMTSCAYYNSAIVIYNWRYQDIRPLHFSTLSLIGLMYYIPTVKYGDKINLFNLRKLTNIIRSISGNGQLINIEEADFFADMFAVYIMSKDNLELSEASLGLVYSILENRPFDVLSAIEEYFDGLIENDVVVPPPNIWELS